MKKAEFEELLLSVREMKEIMAGRQKPGRVWTSEELLGTRIPDVAELRARHNMTQAKFAAVLRVSITKVRDWEHKRRVPEGHEMVRLQMLDQHPEVALKVEHCQSPSNRGAMANAKG
jgi:DNA-binding transcriptional regulator YiaG